jgi:carbamoyl-phosphate synthase small subunit
MGQNEQFIKTFDGLGSKLLFYRQMPLQKRPFRINQMPFFFRMDQAILQHSNMLIIQFSLSSHYPVFGICLGHQVLTHAIGAQTYKLKFGHRGGNQPVKNVETGKVAITSQNHGFASDKDKLEEMGAIVTEYNLNDQTVSGMRLKDLPVFSVQYHPEASPGPNDANHLFKAFHQLVTEHKKKKA